MYGKSSETFETALKTMTFAGGTTDDPGDSGGANATSTLFTVTGTVFMKLFAVVGTTCTGASSTIEVGTAINTTGLLALTTATLMVAGEIWHDATPDASIELASIASEKIVNQNVIQTVRTADVTAGVLKYICLWRSASPGATVSAA